MLKFAIFIRAAAVNGSCSVFIFAGSSVLSDWQQISAQTLPRRQEAGSWYVFFKTIIAVFV